MSLKVSMKEEKLVIGLMSGTSADGIDAVLTRIKGCGLTTEVEQIAFLFQPFSPKVREKILQLAEGSDGGTREITSMSHLLGNLYRDACLSLCEKAQISPKEIDLVGNHGQTVWHMPLEEDYLGYPVRGTLQIGEDSYIAEALGCPVVGDFRVRDMAAGGLGAPLVPYTEYLLYRQKDKTVALQNIGGIANVTILPKNCTIEQVTAFDTGPGNMVMDAIVSEMTKGEKNFDEEGRLALQGTLSKELLQYLLEDPYLKKAPPKTTGREYFGASYVKKIFEFGKAKQIKEIDLLTTATRFTAECIRIGVEAFAPSYPEQMILGGGGSKNKCLRRDLEECLPGCHILTNEEIGFDSDAKEAVAFAILANEAYEGMANNVPAVTGASHPVIMGKITR